MSKYPLLENLWAGDIETTGLLEAMRKQPNPRLHNLGLINAETLDEVLFEGSDKDKIQAFLNSHPTIIMHNGVLFDKEALRLLGYDVSHLVVIDTLFISWYLEPRRLKHGLEEYGEEFGVPKPPIADWESLTQDEYNHRVMQDCRIQIKLWQKQYRQLLSIYGTHAEVMRFISYLMTKANHLRIQQGTRWKLNIPECEKLKAEIDKKVELKFEELKATMPKVPIKKIKNRPAKCFKQDGSLSKAGVEWKVICDNNNLDFNDLNLAVMMIKGYEVGNPNSSPQLKDWLFKLGWEPETFKFVRNKETNEMKKIPQITIKDEDDNPDICPSLYKLAEENPEAGIEHLIGYGVLKHRSSICKGFLANHVDGYLTARCQGLTNTLRLKHRELVNLPSLRVIYGKELRGLLTCDDDQELLGSDLCSLEDRIKHHYQWNYDPEYVKAQMADDYDPHLAICLIGGLLNGQQVADHKAGVQKYSNQRSLGKSTNYS